MPVGSKLLWLNRHDAEVKIAFTASYICVKNVRTMTTSMAIYAGDCACITMVGETGFEPATPWSQTRCATSLRHSPTALRLSVPCRIRKRHDAAATKYVFDVSFSFRFQIDSRAVSVLRQASCHVQSPARELTPRKHTACLDRSANAAADIRAS